MSDSGPLWPSCFLFKQSILIPDILKCAPPILCSFDIYFLIFFTPTTCQTLRPQHLWGAFFHSFLYKPCIHTNLIKILWQVCVWGGGGGSIDRLMYIFPPPPPPLIDISVFGNVGSELSLVLFSLERPQRRTYLVIATCNFNARSYQFYKILPIRLLDKSV